MGLFDFLAGTASTERLDEAIQGLRDIRTPEVSQQQLFFDELSRQGELSPEALQAIELGPSAFGGISLDPTARNAQLEALERLRELGGAEGLDPVAQAQLLQAQGQVSQQLRGARQAALQGLAQRGIAGSGLELAAQLSAQQQAAQQLGTAGFQAAGGAQLRALQALGQAGQLGGQIRGQEFSEASRTAAAADEIARFNAANLQGVLGTNVAARNQAQAANLAEQQRIAEANAAISREQQLRNKSLIQQEFENRLARQQGLLGAEQGRLGTKQEEARRKSALIGGLIESGVGAVSSGFTGGAASVAGSGVGTLGATGVGSADRRLR